MLKLLKKVNEEKLDDLARQLVQGGAAKWKDVVAEIEKPPTKKLIVDAALHLDAEQLCLRLLRLNTWVGARDHDGATQEDVEKCRRFPQKKYSDREAAWFVPVTEPNVLHLMASWSEDEYELTPGAKLLLSYHLDTLKVANASLDERLKFMADGIAPKIDDYFYADNGKPPHAAQIVAFASARDAEFFGLIMEMGTGKTRVMIDVMCDRARRARIKWAHDRDYRCEYTGCGRAECDAEPTRPTAKEYESEVGALPPQLRVLVVAPRTVCHTWENELAEWATVDVNAERFNGGKLQRSGKLLTLLEDNYSPILCGIVNYEGVEVMEDYLKPADKSAAWDLMICDESIWIKNPDAKRSKAVYRVAEYAKSRFILTGLPITKNVLDLYGQFHFVKPGILGYTSFYAFQQYFGESSYFGGHQTYKKEKLPELQERLAKFSFNIKRSQCFDLPPKLYQTVEPEMSDEQASAYEQMAEEMLVDLERAERGEILDADGVQHELAMLSGDVSDNMISEASIVLVRMLRLQQITSGFLTMKDGSLHRFKEQPKLDAVEERLSELPDDARIVVWSRFRPEIDAVVERFRDKYGARPLYGGQNDKVRESYLKAHQTMNGCRMLVIQPASGGFGLNELIGTTYAEYLSNSWSLQHRMQSEDRTTRLGIKQSVLYTDYVYNNTIDQIILDRIKMKRELCELLTDRKAVIAALRTQMAARQNQ